MASKKSSGGSGIGVLIAIVVVLLLILFSVIRKHPVVGIILLILAVASVALVIVLKRKKKKPVLPEVAEKSAPAVPDTVNREALDLPAIHEDYLRAYWYTDRLFIPDDVNAEVLRGKSGKSLRFIFEPENSYDPNAVALYVEDDKIGYVYKGKIQDMLHDWNARNEPFLGALNTYSIPDRTATYKIGFYKAANLFQSKEFPITKISKKADEFSGDSRFDQIQFCDVGDELKVSESYDSDALLVTDSVGNEIGELSASGSKFMRENEDRIVVCVLSVLDIDLDDKVTAKITFYYK